MIRLIQLEENDLNNIVNIHILAFPGFFLTDLGKDVLRVFYEALIQDESTIVWGIKNNKELVGFFVASTAPIGLYARIFKKHFFKFFLPLTISFLKTSVYWKECIHLLLHQWPLMYQRHIRQSCFLFV